MMEVTLHPAPRWRDVVLEQIRVTGLSLQREALVVAVVLAVGTSAITTDVVHGGPGFDTNETFPTAILSFLFPFLVWRSDKRFRPAFLWTLPVDRRRLALAKVFAGGVWLLVALAVFVAWLLALGLFAGASPTRTVLRIPFVATVSTYLFGSALVLGLRHPLRWLLGTTSALLLMGWLRDAIGQPKAGEWPYVPGAGAFFSALHDSMAARLTLPDPAEWAIATFLSLGAGLAALWAAASRHREHRRH